MKEKIINRLCTVKSIVTILLTAVFCYLAIVGKDFDYIEIKDYADKVKEELLKLDDTSKVEILGAAQEAVYLYYDNSKLARYNLSPTELQNILSGTNIIAQSGKILVGDRYILVQSDDNYTDVENIKNPHDTQSTNNQINKCSYANRNQVVYAENCSDKKNSSKA